MVLERAVPLLGPVARRDALLGVEEARVAEPESVVPVPPSTSAAPAAEIASPANTPIAIDDFAKVELRVAVIISAERLPNADKLLKLEIDLGTERRTILSGIAQFYEPESLPGKRIVVVANLLPRKMRGVESHGMLLAAGGREPGADLGLVILDRDIPAGTRVS